MKLNLGDVEVNRGQVLGVNKFGIGDEAVVVSILRHKMYSNPIKTICQEVPSNARDAHREAGNDETPIEIIMPSALDRNFYIRDFGPGISPHRVANVFVLYGNSTKRNDDDETGGFGLGAKCPFSYVDTFGVTTYIPENGSMIQRDYIAAIDESNIGELSLVSEQAITDEKQGTKITIACKPNDEKEFVKWVRVACKYWGVRPVIRNRPDFDWEDRERSYEGNGWFIETGGYNYYSEQEVKILLDGIPYRVAWDNLSWDGYDSDNLEKYSRLFKFPLFLEFNTGELPMTANREEIDYTDEAIIMIQDKLEEVLKDLTDKISKEIATASDLWEANIKWNSIRHQYQSLVDTVEWNGEEVSGYFPKLSKIGAKLWLFHRNNSYGVVDKNTFRKGYASHGFQIEKSAKVLIGDEKTKTPNRRRLKTVFAENEDVSKIYVLSLPLDDDAKRAETAKELKDAKMDDYGVENITAYEKAKIQKGSSTSGSTSGYSMPQIWQNTLYGSSGQDQWVSTEDNDMIEDGYGVYVLLLSREPYLASTGEKISNYTLSELQKLAPDLPNGTIYGIAKRKADKVGKGWIKLEDWLKTKADEIVKAVDGHIVKHENNHLLFNNVNNHASDYTKNEKLLTCPDGIFGKYIKNSEVAQNNTDSQQKLRNIDSFFKMTSLKYTSKSATSLGSWDIEKDYKELMATYSLLKCLWDSYGYHEIEAIYEYINYIDSKQMSQGYGPEEEFSALAA